MVVPDQPVIVAPIEPGNIQFENKTARGARLSLHRSKPRNRLWWQQSGLQSLHLRWHILAEWEVIRVHLAMIRVHGSLVWSES